jgi:hypothetical protein
MKLPLVYAQIKVDHADPRRERPFQKDHQDFQHNMRNMESSGSATTNGGWTVSTSIRKSTLANGTIGGRNLSSGE